MYYGSEGAQDGRSRRKTAPVGDRYRCRYALAAAALAASPTWYGIQEQK
jgi:hypothetical protein